MTLPKGGRHPENMSFAERYYCPNLVKMNVNFKAFNCQEPSCQYVSCIISTMPVCELSSHVYIAGSRRKQSLYMKSRPATSFSVHSTILTKFFVRALPFLQTMSQPFLREVLSSLERKFPKSWYHKCLVRS